MWRVTFKYNGMRSGANQCAIKFTDDFNATGSVALDLRMEALRKEKSIVINGYVVEWVEEQCGA